MSVSVTVNETTRAVAVTVSNERGPAGPAGTVLDSYVADIETLPDYPASFPTTPADIANIGGSKLIGRHAGTTGAGQEIGIDGGLEFHGGNLRRAAVTGPVTIAAGGSVSAIANNALSIAMTSGLQTALDGKITNTASALATTIATNPAAIRTASETGQENGHLYGLSNCVNIASTSGDFPLSAILLGDSFTDFFDYVRGARIVGGYRTSQATGGGDSGVTTITGEYDKSPDGSYRRITSGGNLTCAHLISGQQGPASRIYYTLFPGTGTAQLQYSDNGGAWTNIGSTINTASIATGSALVGSVEIGFALRQVRGRVVASGGTVNGWIGQGLSGPGITAISFATSGQGIEQVMSVTENAWKAMVAGYRTSGGGQIISCTFLDNRFAMVGTATYPKGTDIFATNGAMDSFWTWSKSANSTCDWLMVGPHNVDPSRNDPTDATIDPLYVALGIGQTTQERAVVDFSNKLREWAAAKNEGYVDCRNMVPSYSIAFAQGMFDDDIHLNAKGEAFKRAWVWANSNLGWLCGSEGYRSSIRLGNATLTGALNRVTGTSGMIASMNPEGTSHTPMIASEFIIADGAVPELRGLSFNWLSRYIGRISYRGEGSYTHYVDFMVGGIRPSTVAGSLLGDSTNPWERLYIDKTITAAGTTGARTINKTAGRVNFAAAATSLVVTSSLVTVNSIIIATVATNDATMKSVAAVAAAGSFTLHANAAPTGETAVNWFVVN